jgi:hypothetical protein
VDSPTLKHSSLEHTMRPGARPPLPLFEYFQICRTAASWRTASPWYSIQILRDRFCAKSLPKRASRLTRGPCWGVVQLVGHLTVNEDGEGSNPSAPAKVPDKIAAKITSTDFNTFSNINLETIDSEEVALR